VRSLGSSSASASSRFTLPPCLLLFQCGTVPVSIPLWDTVATLQRSGLCGDKPLSDTRRPRPVRQHRTGALIPTCLEVRTRCTRYPAIPLVSVPPSSASAAPVAAPPSWCSSAASMATPATAAYRRPALSVRGVTSRDTTAGAPPTG
jgi:hypothetical protein